MKYSNSPDVQITPTILPTDQAMVALGGICRAMLYILINRGDLERVKIGSRTFVTTASIDAFIERNTDTARASA